MDRRFLLPLMSCLPASAWAAPGAVEAVFWPLALLGLLFAWWCCALLPLALLRIAARVAATAGLFAVLHRPWLLGAALLALVLAVWLELRRLAPRNERDSGFEWPSLWSD
ncbi:MAG: hypothetical protein U1E77_19790 [Inhella sp.]